MKIFIGSDHGGFELKQTLKAYLAELGHEVHDFGCHRLEACDYPDYAFKVAESKI